MTFVNVLYNATRTLSEMNTGFLSNPAPDAGYDAVMAALAPHSAPAEGSLGGTTPSVQNRVKQTFVNPVATYPFIAARWSQNYEESFHPGDLMFIWKGSNNRASSVVLANLPLLNHLMKSQSIEENRKFQSKEDWAYIGVMRNSAVASGRPNTGRSGSGGTRFAAERIINIDVRGATRMFNYWKDAKASSHLYLAWNEVTYDTGLRDIVLKRKRDVEKGPNDKQATCWQLLPFRIGQDNSSDKSSNAFWNDSMKILDGTHRPIRVGYVFQEVGNGEQSSSNIAIREATQLGESRFRLPLIHGFLRV